MKRNTRRRWIGMLSLGLIAVTAIVVVLAVFGGTNDDRFTATGYSDVIRFQVEGVVTLQVRIFDLSGKEVWGSGVVSGDIIDWDRRNDTGERLAYGAYIYSAQGWNAQGDLIFQKNGKLALMPGDKVQLQAAPVVLPLPSDTVAPYSASDDKLLAPMGHTPGISTFDQVGIGTMSPLQVLHLMNGLLDMSWDSLGNANQRYCRFGVDAAQGLFMISPRNDDGSNAGEDKKFVLDLSNGNVGIGTTSPVQKLHVMNGLFDMSWDSLGNANQRYCRFGVDAAQGLFIISPRNDDGSNAGEDKKFVLDLSNGNVGIGTTSPTAKLEIESSTGQDLIAAYPSSSRLAGAAVFVVKSTGEVRADGAYYSGAGDCNTGGFNAGGADVAERINVSEWVEAGDVVEIDPEHPGFFRKSTSAYSTRVAGIISTSPGVILGNNFDEATDDWDDNRPVLAVTGRVPCKVSAENGPIEIGDLLVASSTPGIAMKGNPERAIGAVVGKAMEPLEDGEGTIVVQVMLR